MTAGGGLAEALVGLVADQLEQLVARHLPGWRVPGVFAGHQVLPDVRADLAFTLGLLNVNGVQQVAGTDVAEAVRTVLAPIDGPGTHSFFSYRVAETVERLGLQDWMPSNVVEACDSTSFLPLLADGALPRNYAAVLARCEQARQRLGLPVDEEVLAGLVAQTATLLADGYLDDSQSRIGRYDIYTADVYLFTEPLATALGPVWEEGARQALGLAGAVAAPDGTAIPWGRSSGALAACLTIELGGLARRLDEDADRWIALAERGLRGFRGWMHDGLITAHQHRSTYDYRGPFRRLQMTLDCLGKLAAAALDLVGAPPPVPPEWPALFPPRDELIVFDAGRRAGVWAYRSHDLAFSLPVVGATVTDYLPAPRQPGLFEVPVGTDLPTGVPVVFAGGRRYTAGQLPAAWDKQPGSLTLTYDGFARSGRFELEPGRGRPFPGRRVATTRVEGRTLHVTERLDFDTVPDAVAIQVAETAHRPLAVTFTGGPGAAVTTVDVAGLKEYRSFWAELPVVHQVDLAPARHLEVSYRVTPKLRVLTTARPHHYHRSLYDPLADRVAEGQVSFGRPERDLDRWDLFHLHWPEWLFGADVERHRRFIAALAAAEVRVVWTQHNLLPHDRDPAQAAAHEEIYGLWAAATAAAVHHSRWGEEQVRTRYRFAPAAIHRVIPHGHFGHRRVPAARAEVERELGLTPGRLRLAVVGAPRPEKDVTAVVDAFRAAGRADLELLVLSLDPGAAPIREPGIVALPYEFVDEVTYNRRLAAVDLLVLPFRPGLMLTTGTVGDAVGFGLPALVSDWPFLTEVLGDAAIVYGQGADALAAVLRALSAEQVAAAASAARRRQARYDWTVLAERTFALLCEVGTAKL